MAKLVSEQFGNYFLKNKELTPNKTNVANYLNYFVITKILALRNLIIDPNSILNELELNPGMKILDFGCGPGCFSILASKHLQGTGQIFSLDSHPLAIKNLKMRINYEKIKNITPIISSCETGLPENSVDIIFLRKNILETK